MSLPFGDISASSSWLYLCLFQLVIFMSLHLGDICVYPLGDMTGRIVQSVMCLTADSCLTVDPGVSSSIQAQFHNFVEIYHEIIPTAILIPSADLRRVVVSFKQKYGHEVLVNH